jgi:hypothetical protein
MLYEGLPGHSTRSLSCAEKLSIFFTKKRYFTALQNKLLTANDGARPWCYSGLGRYFAAS